jgi:CubicO group peptidase (beta-lactamase class C family)
MLKSIGISFKYLCLFRAGGGFLSTARDVATFGNAFLTSKLFSTATRNLLWTPQTTSSGKNINWGLGWKVEVLERDPNGTPKKRIISHSGGAVGATYTKTNHS